MNMHPDSVSDLGLAPLQFHFPQQQIMHPIVSSIHAKAFGPTLRLFLPSRRKGPFETMKTPKLHSPRKRFLTLIAMASVVTLIHPLTGDAKDHVDLQFWDMIWGGPEYIDTGKALVAQFNQEHPDITVTYRSVPWTDWYQTFLTAIGFGNRPGHKHGGGLPGGPVL
jgi:hypothetical protein